MLLQAYVRRVYPRFARLTNVLKTTARRFNVTIAAASRGHRLPPPFTASRTPDTVNPIRPIDPVITFLNSQHEAVRGTLTNVQRRSLVMEIYNP